MATLITSLCVLGILVVSCLAWAVFLRLGLKWARVTEVTKTRLIASALAVFALQVLIVALFGYIASTEKVPAVVLGIAELIASIAVTCLVIQWFFHTSFLRAVQAWLPTLLSIPVALAAAFFVTRPFLLEAFEGTSNSMAPTFLGIHLQAKCVECSSPAYCTPFPAGQTSVHRPGMICDHFHVTQPTIEDRTEFPADRIWVAKFIRPQRWDLILFKFPAEPGSVYISRLVGLPGETIEIRDGEIWADGKKLTPPAEIHDIQYESKMPQLSLQMWGTADHPAVLADDEYFVLGDFSQNAADSRLWQIGAPDHHPYAVPKSNLIGVATHIYWPPSRWRILR